LWKFRALPEAPRPAFIPQNPSGCLSPAVTAAQDGPINFSTGIPKLVGALVLALLLGACSPNVPTAKRGSVETFRDGRMISARTLEENQARAVSAWFMTHGSGWSRDLGSVAPGMMIRLQHSDRETTVINLSGTTVVVTNSTGQFTKTLSPAEAAELGNLAGEPSTQP
jgi:hypothetical protein